MRWHKMLAAAGLACLLFAAAPREAASQSSIVQDHRAVHAWQRARHCLPPDGRGDRQQHGPSIVVENRPGAGTVVGTEVVQRADPDGSMVLLVASSFVINPALKRGNYDVAKDFAPVCYLASTPMVLVVQGTSPYKTLADLIAAARPSPANSPSPAAARAPRCMSPSRCCAVPPTSISPMCRSAAPRPRSRRCWAAMSRGLGGLSDRGGAAAGRHAARPRHHLACACRDAARRADLRGDRREQLRSGYFLRHRGAGEDARRHASRN